MSRDVLIISNMQGVENCARLIEEQTGTHVAIASGRRAGLVALRAANFAVVVVDENLIETDEEWADQVWAQVGLAMPLQVNFAISGCARLSREIKAALVRRTGEEAIARRAVESEMQKELRSSVTGLLLESELALREPMSATLQPKVRHLVELAGQLRERLQGAA